MSIKLPSEINQFSQELQNILNNKFMYQKKASGWGTDFDGRILVHIQADNSYPIDIYMIFHLEDGKCKDIDVTDEEPNSYGFAYRGSYSDWKKLITSGQKEMLSDGTFEMEGDLETWLAYKHVNYLRVGCAQVLDVEFEY